MTERFAILTEVGNSFGVPSLGHGPDIEVREGVVLSELSDADLRAIGRARIDEQDMTNMVAGDLVEAMVNDRLEITYPDAVASPYGADQIAIDHTRIDRAAEDARLQFITPGAGQALVYERKAAEAATYAAAETPNPDDYPFLKARAERLDPDAPDYDAVAQEWNLQAAQWASVATIIENTREQAKEDISAAADHASATAIIDGLVWPVPGA